MRSEYFKNGKLDREGIRYHEDGNVKDSGIFEKGIHKLRKKLKDPYHYGIYFEKSHEWYEI